MVFYGLEKLSLVDYDGKVAATVFTGACNFKCGFCHNGPLVESVDSLKTLSENEVLSYFSSRKGILDGVCITGGEPTLHKDLPFFIEKVKKLGLSVKVDTNGTNPEMIKSLYENGLADYFAMDVKNDKKNYALTVGLPAYDTGKIEKSVDFFLTGNADYEFRTTIINEYHSAENVKNIAEWIKGAKRYFLQKFKEVDTCLTHGLHEVPEEKALEFIKIAKPFVPETRLRGY